MNSRIWRPDELLYELAIDEPEQINVEALAKFCGADVVFEPLRGCEANILGNGDRAIITVNNRSLPERQRFSVAHELGHWMFDRGTISMQCDQRSYYLKWFLAGQDPEVRANRFAADLLLPKAMFEPKARSLVPSLSNIRKLAGEFRMSLTATAIRMVELGSYNAIVYCTMSGRRKWFKESQDLPRQLWPKDWPGVDTLASRLRNSTRGQEMGPQAVRVDGWIEHRNASECMMMENSVKMTDDLILTLLWWRDEEQLLELLGDEDELYDY